MATRYRVEFKRRLDDVNEQVTQRERRAKKLGRLYYGLNFTAILLAAVSGFGGLAGLLGDTAVSCVLLAAAIFIGINTFYADRLKKQATNERVNHAVWKNLHTAIENAESRVQSEDNTDRREELYREEIARIDADIARARSGTVSEFLSRIGPGPSAGQSRGGGTSNSASNDDEPSSGTGIVVPRPGADGRQDAARFDPNHLTLPPISLSAAASAVFTAIQSLDQAAGRRLPDAGGPVAAVLDWSGGALGIVDGWPTPDVGERRSSNVSEGRGERDLLRRQLEHAIVSAGDLLWLVIVLDRSPTGLEEEAVINWQLDWPAGELGIESEPLPHVRVVSGVADDLQTSLSKELTAKHA